LTKRIRQEFIGVGFILMFALALPAADLKPLRWEIKDGMAADTIQAERIYEAACGWIEDHFASARTPIRPKITIHVGVACPDESLNRACYSTASSELYLPEWSETAPAAVAHATLIAGLFELMSREQIRETVAKLINEDAQNFVSARSSAASNSFRK
jgi:hypothetical protein